MTEKIYYQNAYTADFTAEILSVTEVDGCFDVVLDRSAFFPEEGGQSSDKGKIGDATVKQVYEEDSIIHHLVDRAITCGSVDCHVDFDERFEKMQCHTAEHILCGIIHSLYGFDNVGFHLGDEEVTFDVDGVLTREQLDRVELLANKAVFSNLTVQAFFPSPEELARLEYRSKLDIKDGVRLIKIGRVDLCACCAPHVDKTGEIGIIKILDFMKHRGGTRIWMVAGFRALNDYRSRYDNVKRISAMLCTPQLETANTLTLYMKDSENVKLSLKNARLRIAELEAEKIGHSKNNEVFLLEDFQINELIAFSNVAVSKTEGITVALSGREGDYKYVISSRSVDLKAMSRDINSTLNGKGGGRSEMIQGGFACTIEQIRDYFINK